MTVGKATALAAGFVGAMALGVVIGPTVRDTWNNHTTNTDVVSDSAPAPEATPVATPRRATPVTTPRARATKADPAREPGAVPSVTVAVWEPDLRDRVQKVLNKGTKMELAAENFATAEQFVTVAHAARNTELPFVVLKHRVLDKGQTLAEAIHEFKPELDAKSEVARARAAAQADLGAN